MTTVHGVGRGRSICYGGPDSRLFGRLARLTDASLLGNATIGVISQNGCISAQSCGFPKQREASALNPALPFGKREDRQPL